MVPVISGRDFGSRIWRLIAISSSWKGQYTILQRGVKHVLTHRVLLADFALLQSEEQPPLPSDYIWVDEAVLGDYAVPRLVEHLYRQVRLYDEKNA